MKHLLLLPFLLISASTLASVEGFKKYLAYHNSAYPTAIRFDTWYSVRDLINGKNDLVSLIAAAEKKSLSIVVEEEGQVQNAGKRRYVAKARTMEYDSRQALYYNIDFGIGFRDSPSNYDRLPRYADDHAISLTRAPRIYYDDDRRILFASSGALQPKARFTATASEIYDALAALPETAKSH